jgi:hypothetical protein
MGSKFVRAGGLMVAGLAVGYLLGPPIVNAATTAASDVMIIDRDSSNRADVTSKHRVLVDSEAAVTDLGGDNFLDTYGLQYTQPNGQEILNGSSSSCTASSSAAVVLAAVNINLSSAPAALVTVTLKDLPSDIIAYETTFNTGEVGSHDFTFDGGIFMPGGYKLQVTGSTTGLHCQVIGDNLGTAGDRPQLHAPRP